MIDIETASQLLDFGARIGPGQRAEEQLQGAVAVHNLLAERGVAYLADEVGMGKTYVALGALALFRHFQPDFRVLVIAPRENIQKKWLKELRNFVAHNVRFPDLRVKAIDGQPARPLVACGNLLELLREATLNPNRDFFLRLTSFSLPLTGKDAVDPTAAKRLRDGLREHLPWLPDGIFDLRNNKQAFKENVAKALCCALPRFDLVIVDEGHNLKHGFKKDASARNRLVGLALGHADEDEPVDPRQFPHYGRRAKRVLFLSATPVEETYCHLYNQLQVFGLERPFQALCRDEASEEEKKAAARQFLIRRVTAVRAGDEELTKNLYRREWRRGGVSVFDEPLQITDPRQRLVVALVQKKVSEILGHEKFNASFQIGMLASFESFLETAKLKRDDGDGSNFDDPEQTDKEEERKGIDVDDINGLARSYRKRFGAEMPHPKMDGLVDALAQGWRRGTKSLVFVRRVASVKELKRKLDERYDQWLFARLHRELPDRLHPQLDRLKEQYGQESPRDRTRDQPTASGNGDAPADIVDQGGNDTFFAWFFRGKGPDDVVSGATIQQRFIQRGATYATFFEDNHVAHVLGCRPGEVESRLAEALGLSREALREGLRERSRHFLSSAVKRHQRAERFEAVQGAAIEWLQERAGPCQEKARVVWHEWFAPRRRSPAASAPDIGRWLETPTFFTEIRGRPRLREVLWPASAQADQTQAFRDQMLRAQMLASAARLGHGLIDLYVMTVRRLASLDMGSQEVSDDEEGRDVAADPINEYLDHLESQMATPLADREWGGFDELAEIARNFDLIVDVNRPAVRGQRLKEAARAFGGLLGQQQPVGGMAGQVNQTLIHQFRMPGYPLVLISTDLLQEGEDLHTFCSSIYHYGISWTPSAMEQRIGRIDRVRSQTDRRLSTLPGRLPEGAELLQVYFPHLEDTVEVLQVQRVLERMNEFLRLMHEGLTTQGNEERTIDVSKEIVRARRHVPQIRERLTSAFPIRDEHLNGRRQPLAATRHEAAQLASRFRQLAEMALPGLDVVWEPQKQPTQLLGTARLGDRVQPFQLELHSLGALAVIRCVSPVGSIDLDGEAKAIMESAQRESIKIGVIRGPNESVCDLTVEGDVLLGVDPATDADRVAMLVRRTVSQADQLEGKHLPGKDRHLEDVRSKLEPDGRQDSDEDR